ncbi:hypothetical protein P3S68_015269 [Capsicum galapagoense]
MTAIEKVKLIRDILKTAQSRQKSYADLTRRDLEFEVDDLVYLKFSPKKGVKKFGKKVKLSPRYVGPYRILNRVGRVAYEIELPAELSTIHLVFHVSILRKHVGDCVFVNPSESPDVQDSLSFDEVPVEILDNQVRRLRNKEVSLVKVLWQKQSIKGATWKAEADMRTKYPHLFSANPDQAKVRKK